jgi:hypothetical protein
MAWVGETGFLSYRRQRSPGSTHQRLCPLDPQSHDVALGADADRLFTSHAAVIMADRLKPAIPGLAVVDTCCAASRGSSRDAGITHRRQGAADNSLGARDEAVHSANLKALAEFQANRAKDYRQQADYHALRHDHFPPFAEKIAGISFNSGT